MYILIFLLLIIDKFGAWTDKVLYTILPTIQETEWNLK